MKRIVIGKKIRKAATVALAAIFALSTALSIVQAAPPTDTPSPSGTPGSTANPLRRDGRELLERLFNREKQILTQEGKRLDLAGRIETKIQEYIDKQKAAGQDTSALETALANLKTAVNSAQSDHDTAKSIIDTHAGFGPGGEVIDLAQARTTVRTAGQAEREFHRTVLKGVNDLRKAIKDYRSTHKPQTGGSNGQQG